MTNRVGRPTKEETVEKMKLEYNPDTKIPSEGLLYFGDPYKFSNEREFKNCLTLKLRDSFTCPMQPVLMNFGRHFSTEGRYINAFYWHYNNAPNYLDNNIYDAACSVAMEFNIVHMYDSKYYEDLEEYAYYFVMNLDLRKINHNWSVVYQIISDIHYRLFNYFLGVYILELPNYNRSPIATLHIFISNAGIQCKRFLTDSLKSMKHSIANDAKYIVDSIYDSCQYNNNGIPVFSPITIDTYMATNKFLPDNCEKCTKELNKRWYEDLYGYQIYDSTPVSNYKPNTRITMINEENARKNLSRELIARDFKLLLEEI